MKRPLFTYSIAILFSIWTVAVSVSAQRLGDPRPELLAVGKTDRLFVEARDVTGKYREAKGSAFYPSESIEATVYIRGLDLMPGEGVNSIRSYLFQKSGKTFELRNVSLTRHDKDTYALRLRLADIHGYRGQPVADGDSLFYVTWRGMMSNALRVQFGDVRAPIEKPTFLDDTARSIETTELGDIFTLRSSADRARFQEQASFGPTVGVDTRLRFIGVNGWISEQFDVPYPTIPLPNVPQKPTNPPSDCQLTTNPTCYREHYTMSPLQRWFFQEAFYGDAQLRHRVAWALSQIWVTSGVSVQQSSHAIAYHKLLSDNAFGNYRDLMKAVTLSPTMGHYLDMVRSTKTNPNENYPREILQLFSVGLFKLNQDGSLQLDDMGRPIDTYDQAIINDLSKVFTGWNYCNIGCPNSAPGVLNYKDPMIVNPANHDTTAKTLMDYPGAVHRMIPACIDCATSEQIRAYAELSLDRALDNIFYHPNVGPFIGKLLIQHMVTSDPSPAYIERVAAAFNNNGNGVRGDMRAVIRAILLDPEARGGIKTAPRYGKLREPVQLITNLGRIFPAMDFAATSRSDGALASHSDRLGQNPFNSPTVFNYFSPDFVVPGTTINAPEFEIMNTSRAVARTNFLHILVFEGITANATDSLRGTSLDVSEMLPYALADPSGSSLVDGLNVKMLHGAMSPQHRASVLSAVQAVPESNPTLRVRTGIYLIAASSQFQVQR